MLAATGVVCVVGGLAARAGLDRPDRAVYDWFAARADPGGSWARLHADLTRLGDQPAVGWAAVAVAVAGALAFARVGLRWWTPVVAVLAAVVGQRIAQVAVSEVVGRAADRPAGIGNYPSGGVSRLLVVWGVAAGIAWLATGRRTTVARVGVAVAAAGAWVVGYGRLLLLAHYPSDLPGGLVLGAGIAGAVVLALVAVAPAGRPEAVAAPAPVT